MYVCDACPARCISFGGHPQPPWILKPCGGQPRTDDALCCRMVGAARPFESALHDPTTRPWDEGGASDAPLDAQRDGHRLALRRATGRIIGRSVCNGGGRICRRRPLRPSHLWRRTLRTLRLRWGTERCDCDCAKVLTAGVPQCSWLAPRPARHILRLTAHHTARVPLHTLEPLVGCDSPLLARQRRDPHWSTTTPGPERARPSGGNNYGTHAAHKQWSHLQVGGHTRWSHPTSTDLSCHTPRTARRGRTH